MNQGCINASHKLDSTMIGKESTNAFPDEMHFNIFVLLSLFLNLYPVASCYSVPCSLHTACEKELRCV